MLFATVNGEKVEASPKTSGICPLCQGIVFSKCGEINVWHWSHHKDKSCDSWYEPETEWHKNWKFAFGKDNCEIVISKDGVRHIADIFTNDSVIIELQNSPLQKSTIRKREIFYEERMLWLVNGIHFKDNFQIFTSRSDRFEELNWRFNHIETQQGFVDRDTGEIVPPPKKEFSFSWSWPRKSWTDAQRNLFIDFGEDNLFWVTYGMGTSQGKGRQVSKESFLKKYGGNTEFLQRLSG